EAIDVLFCGRPGATLSDTEDALAHEGSGFFPRPVAVPSLLKKIESLASGVVSTPAPPAPKPAESTPPRISTRPPPSDPPPSRPPASRPPPSMVPSLRGPGSQRGATPSLVSRELAELLSRAEDAVGDPSGAAHEAPASPEDEIEAVLPEDVLAALDAPLEDEEEGDEVEGPSRVTTSGGRAANTTGVREPPPAPPVRPPSVAPPELLTHDGTV